MSARVFDRSAILPTPSGSCLCKVMTPRRQSLPSEKASADNPRLRVTPSTHRTAGQVRCPTCPSRKQAAGLGRFPVPGVSAEYYLFFQLSKGSSDPHIKSFQLPSWDCLPCKLQMTPSDLLSDETWKFSPPPEGLDYYYFFISKHRS